MCLPRQLTPLLFRTLSFRSSLTSKPSYKPHCSSISCRVLVTTISAASNANSSPSILLIILYVELISSLESLPCFSNCSNLFLPSECPVSTIGTFKEPDKRAATSPASA
ncbi:hypothetical protein HanPI659440_Chr05g0205691 [Helianthus annuus]|nr:hypothetical protein HanHA300_Chr05g0180831 [Helianthus annuus]KAJ0585021.1 hypothetical protein HanHA89_Chr05g0195521 [Helianthus annuus]KAJ0750691.1 hypothetical protein HanLR1_Chr05g0184891 [Helianthus annuus]KAJ0789622.1 hypothetical protein HanPI659440_Chr05g0205691 [Helianthus annuus]